MHIELIAGSLDSNKNVKSKRTYLTFEIDIEIMYNDFLYYQEKAANGKLTKNDLLQMIEMDLKSISTCKAI